MNAALAATFLWLLSIGLETSNWLPFTVFCAGATALAIGFRIPLVSMRSAALLSFGSAILLSIGWWLRPAKFQSEPSVLLDHSFGWPFDVLRRLAREANVGITPDSEALTLGLAIGDSSQASAQLISDMKIVSLTHLVAVSGANCAIVVSSTYLLFRRFSLRARVIVSISVLIAYVFLVGAQPSVLRAAVMAIAVMLSFLSGRKTHPMNILAIAVIVLLVHDSTLSVNISFALSVAATAGILLLAPALYERFKKKLLKPIALALAVSVAAQVMCFPILLQMQPGLPTYSLIANLLCEPFVGPITVLSLIAVSVSWFEPLASALFYISSLASLQIVSIAHFFANLPLATAPWLSGTSGLLLAIFFTLCVAGWLRANSAQARFAFGVVALLCLTATFAGLSNSAIQFSRWPQSDWQIVSCDVGQGDATVIRSADRVALIDVGRFAPRIDSCLNRLGISHIDLLVLTHFDLDHVGGLAGALSGRSVEAALLSPFEDDRPAASSSRQMLSYAKIETDFAERGLSGLLGQVSWSVLSPSRNAYEAEDSNDASITMLFRFNSFSLLALADLGERGQMRLAAESSAWLSPWVREHAMVMKVSHHGSADQYAEFIEDLHPTVALLSVGRSNGYGHPTRRTLQLLERTRSVICRTDQLGSLSVSHNDQGFSFAAAGAS